MQKHGGMAAFMDVRNGVPGGSAPVLVHDQSLLGMGVGQTHLKKKRLVLLPRMRGISQGETGFESASGRATSKASPCLTVKEGQR